MTLGYVSAKLADCPLCHSRRVALENFRVEAIIRCSECGLTLKRPHKGVTDSGLNAAIAAWNKRPQASADLTRSIASEADDPRMLHKRIEDLEQLNESLQQQLSGSAPTDTTQGDLKP